MTCSEAGSVSMPSACKEQRVCLPEQGRGGEIK